MILCVDCLCFSSFIRIWFLRSQVKRVYYINITRSFAAFGLWQKCLPFPCEPIPNVNYSEHSWQGKSVYEQIQLLLTERLEQLFSDQRCVFLKEYLKERAYFHLYRLAELSVVRKACYGDQHMKVLVRHSFFDQTWQAAFSSGETLFYRAFGLINQGRIKTRQNHYYDKYIFNSYYTNRLMLVLESGRFLLQCWVRALRPVKKHSSIKARIGVELIQGKVRLNQINDLYWFKDSALKASDVTGIAYEDYKDDSSQELQNLGIETVHVRELPLNGSEILQLTKIILKAWLRLGKSGLDGWRAFERQYFLAKRYFWKSVYQHLSIKVLWSMYDVDADKLVKAAALQDVGGIFAGSHWSNYPMNRIDNQKCYDAVITWGKSYIQETFTQYPHQMIVEAGYPLDFYFEQYRKPAQELRAQFPDQFIISYHDNICGYDLPYSMNMQLQMHNMLMDLLIKYPRATLFLKPKNKAYFKEVCEGLPTLQSLVDAGRIVIFLGEDGRRKAVPALIGMASDVVVGLGISSASAECQFAGTLGLHADLTCFSSNQFANAGLGKIVFRDITTLTEALEECIQKKRSINPQDYKELYEGLDPFCDGNAYKRTGFVLNRLLSFLNEGQTPKRAMEMTSKDYEQYKQEGSYAITR